MENGKFSALCNIRNYLTNMAAEVIQWKHPQETVFHKDRLAALEKEHNKYDPKELTLEQAQQLGFKRWDKTNKLMLAPLWIVPFLVDKLEVADITEPNTPVHVDKKDLDDDARYGCVAWGLTFDELEVEQEAEE